MANKKWFGLAAVVAAIGGAVAYVITRVKESPDMAAEMMDTVKEKAKESPEKVSALVDAAKDRVQNGKKATEADAAEEESAVV